MILLDTNVVSEIMRKEPHQAVRLWFNSRPSQELFLCVPVLAELCYGVERLLRGRRRDLLDQVIQKIVEQAFHDRNSTCRSRRGVRIRAHRGGAKSYREAHRSHGWLDAAIALVHQAAIATRDIDDFTGLGVEVIDPFTVKS